MGAPGGDPLGGAGLLHGVLSADADKLVVATGGEAEFAAVKVGDGLDGAVEQAAVMADDEAGTGEAGEPGFEPEGGFEVEVVGRLVEQQEVGGGEQGGGEGDAHAPAAGVAVDRAGLLRRVKAEPGQDGRGPGGGGVGLDGAEALVDLRQAGGGGAVLLGEEGGALGVGLQHRVEQGLRPGWRLLPHLREAGAGAEPDLAAVDGKLAGDGLQQRALAGAVAPDQADAAAGVDAQVGGVEQGAPGDPQRHVVDDEEAHGGGIARAVVRVEAVRRRGAGSCRGSGTIRRRCSASIRGGGPCTRSGRAGSASGARGGASGGGCA